MTKILIVDDSVVASRLIAKVFEFPNSRFELDFANDGAQGLEKIETTKPELVITDLEMPNVNGLELVSTTKERHPLTPVILVTSNGSEEIAAEALRNGAASYVPKVSIETALLDVVRGILDIYKPSQTHSNLLRRLKQRRYEFLFDSDRSMVSAVVQFIRENLEFMEACPKSDQYRIAVALSEALTNALYHGNLEVDSELKLDDDSRFYELAAERAQLEPYKNRNICVEAEMSLDRLAVVIRDDGPGFDVSALPDPTDSEYLDRPSGRGVMLMRTFFEEVRYNDRGNEVTLVQRFGRQNGTS